MGLCGNLSVMHYDIWGRGYPAAGYYMTELANNFKVRLIFAEVSMDKPIVFLNFDYAMKCHSKFCVYDFQ